MKLAVSVFAILSPVAGWAQLAGDWAGVTSDSQGLHRIVLHVSGPFTAMNATADISDQKLFHAPVESIAFSGSTLEFSIPASDVRYSGLLNDDGRITGTFTQHGLGAPLVLTRLAAVRNAVPIIQTGDPGVVKNGRYHDNLSGVEFDLPADWSLLRTDPDQANPGGVRVFSDRSGKAIVITANMIKGDMPAENIPEFLATVIPHQVAMRAGQTGSGPLHPAPNYKIREGSVRETTIDGQQAVRAIGDLQEGGQNISELLAWVASLHTRIYFMVGGATDNLPLLQASFDQMLETAKIP